MADKPQFETLPHGVPDDRLNGMTPAQFRAMVTGVETQLTGMCQGNGGMIAALLIELQVRMVLDFDELGEGKGDALVVSLQVSFVETLKQWRESVAKAAAERKRGLN